MNTITTEVAELLADMLMNGESVRAIVKKLGVSKNTIRTHREVIYAANGTIPVCKCGLVATHQGWCADRAAKSEERQKVMRQLSRPDPDRCCMDCGVPLSHGAGLRCRACFSERAEKRRVEEAAKVVACKICCASIGRNAKGSFDWHCPTEWCQRLFAFYYVEGRYRPPSVQDARKKGLSFEIFLSDYIRRNAYEIQLGSKYGGAA